MYYSTDSYLPTIPPLPLSLICRGTHSHTTQDKHLKTDTDIFVCVFKILAGILCIDSGGGTEKHRNVYGVWVVKLVIRTWEVSGMLFWVSHGRGNTINFKSWADSNGGDKVYPFSAVAMMDGHFSQGWETRRGYRRFSVFIEEFQTLFWHYIM